MIVSPMNLQDFPPTEEMHNKPPPSRDLTLAVHAGTTLRPAPSTVWTILDEAAVKPHKHTTWLNSRDPEFPTSNRPLPTFTASFPCPAA